MARRDDPGNAAVLRLAGARIREARAAAGLTQAQLAERTGMLCRASVSNLEAGRQDVPLTRLAVIAGVLKVDLLDLVSPGRLPAPPPPPHDVVTRPVLEVACMTCGGLVLDVTTNRAAARESRATHIAAMLEEGR